LTSDIGRLTFAESSPLHEHVQDVARRALANLGLLEHRAERHACPLRHADAAVVPLRARGSLAHQLLEEPAAVAGAPTAVMTEREGRHRRSSKPRSSGRSRASPSTRSRQVPTSIFGLLACERTKKWLAGVR
jgi:hypothetical protein